MFTTDTHEHEKRTQLLLLLRLLATNKVKEDRTAVQNSTQRSKTPVQHIPDTSTTRLTAVENSPQSGCTCLNSQITVLL